MEMFPASAGMNRLLRWHGVASEHVPRERGDEPPLNDNLNGAWIMFPASAGMNRRSNRWLSSSSYVPRERGDEPIGVNRQPAVSKCSPRARG